MCGREHADESVKVLREWFSTKAEFREVLFWAELELMDSLAPSDDSWDRFYNVVANSLLGNLVVSDKAWIERALYDAKNPQRQEVALQLWIRIWAIKGANRRKLPSMRASLGANEKLLAIFDGRTQKPKDSEKVRKYEEEARRHQAEWKVKEETAWQIGPSGA